MKIVTAIFIVIISVTALNANNSYSWEEKTTHRDLSEISANNSVLAISGGDCLTKLGFKSSFDEMLTWNSKKQEIIKWLSDGSELEDTGTNWEMITNVGRSNNHFHNPLSPSWANAGLNDDYTLGEIVYNVVGQSALLWAQNPAKQSAFRNDKAEWDWSWQTVGDYYCKALTSKTENDKEVQI